ncbi:hypothetical protein GCM10010885_16200 [Alicyclobacillus cellulosilyticus]|uniref:HTH cro/C1-type domain-containing protein n=1 Tax=Alicyclobacillus cellulosilyticus TaxID=1003997 RepID=A0A917NKL0_9BACL|nr:helix-turn-helix transcriptional regulator [Alicyclobacillus cellulosilyticus]GGJ07830.1 hypothetical protein GCM10010885_16200 [Alicyclobacillus cellulosilyticus]
MPNIAQTVAQLRRQAGWSLRELSQRTGISISHLSAIENGKRPHPSFQNMVQIAAAFGVPLSYFVEDRQDEGNHVPAAADTAVADAAVSRAYERSHTVREHHVAERMARLYDAATIEFILSDDAPPYVAFARQLPELRQDVPQLLRRIAEWLETAPRQRGERPFAP